jgi:catechol 2,3-dioxygenase-like lactoylglutathione lyase family enzyme
MTAAKPVLGQINLIVRDMAKALAFYRLLGVPVPAEPRPEHVSVDLPNGLRLDFDHVDFVGMWDSAWRGTTGGGGAVVGFSLPSREAVDATYAAVIAAGFAGHQRPYDAFWGSRYAMVEDPDGNSVGLMSPVDAAQRWWPPKPPPR